jgi:hypothetical protein
LSAKPFNGEVETYRYIAFTMFPTILPKVAPMAIEGTNIPAGTLHPYVITTRPMRMIVARSKEFDMPHCAEVLRIVE